VLVYAPGSAMADPNLYVVSPFVAVPVSIIHLEAVSRFASTWADSPLQARFYHLSDRAAFRIPSWGRMAPFADNYACSVAY
jgi:hypothetical protein